MTDDAFAAADKRLPVGGDERKVVFGKTHRLPFNGAGEPLLHIVAKPRVRVKANPLTAQISDHPFSRTSTAFSFDIAVVGSQENTEASIQQ